MMHPVLKALNLVAATLSVAVMLHAQTDVPAPGAIAAGYTLGPGDQIVVKALGVDEFDTKPDEQNKPQEIDLQGYVDVPLVGHVKAAGLTPAQLETQITTQLRSYVRDPHVTVTVAEFKSRPVSIVGEVMEPGVYHLNGQDTLIQVVSQAKGLSDNAGNQINVTREKSEGPIPLPQSTLDKTGQFYTATVDTKRLFQARDPAANIKIKPNDVISVPKAELVYVVGAVNKAGGFVLSQTESMSVLQALSMAEGLEHTAAAGRSKVIHRDENNQRTEVAVNLPKILSGQEPDMPLYPNDILFVPNSAPKSAGLRAIEAAIQLGTGVAIYRH